MIPWLDQDSPFPPLSSALRSPNGLLAAGGSLTPSRLISAYKSGIFPWFSDGDPTLWWSPDPRMVLIPNEFKLSRSLKKRLAKKTFYVTTDTAFRSVMAACATTLRSGQNGTWIVEEIIEAYVRLHELGYAHSVECWQNNPEGERQLVGGLYGVSLGKMFYGESMFAHCTDASKVSLAHLVYWLKANSVPLIDCQMSTPHLASLGGQEISRDDFIDQLKSLTGQTQINWPSGPWEFHW